MIECVGDIDLAGAVDGHARPIKIIKPRIAPAPIRIAVTARQSGQRRHDSIWRHFADLVIEIVVEQHGLVASEPAAFVCFHLKRRTDRRPEALGVVCPQLFAHVIVVAAIAIGRAAES